MPSDVVKFLKAILRHRIILEFDVEKVKMRLLKRYLGNFYEKG